MPSDFPDWGGQYNDRQFFPLFDQAELAARLGSYVTYDRRGSVVWQYGFGDGIGDVGPDVTGASALAALSAAVWENPPFSCKLQCGTTIDGYAAVERRMPVPQPPRVGFQTSVRCSSNVQQVRHFIYHYDGATRWYANLRVNLLDHQLELYADPGVVYVLSDALPDLNTGYYFAHLKLVVDLQTHMCVRAILDADEYDVSAYEMISDADTSAPHVRCRTSNHAVNGTNAVINVDNLIITAAEPPNS